MVRIESINTPEFNKFLGIFSLEINYLVKSCFPLPDPSFPHQRKKTNKQKDLDIKSILAT